MSKKSRSQAPEKRDPKAVAFWSFMTVALVAIVAGYFVATNRTADSDYVSTYVPVTIEPAPIVNVGFIGDSYTRGSGATQVEYRWSSRLAQAEGWAETNVALSGTGYGTAGEVEGGKPYYEQIADLGEANYDIIVVSGGRNDLNDAAAYPAGVNRTFNDLRAKFPHAKIIATSPVWDSTTAPANLGGVARAVQAAVTGVGGTYLDIGEPFAGLPNLIDKDGVHPNDLGHATLSDAVKSVLPR